MTGRFAGVCLAFALVVAVAGSAGAQTRIEKQFDDWLVTCQENETAKTCVMSQTLTDAKTKRTALAWLFDKGADGSMKAVVRTPIGVLLPEGLKLEIAGAARGPIPYRFCGPRACTAEFAFGEEWVALFRKEAELTAGFMSVAGQLINLKLSLKGFSAAYDYFVAQ